MLGMLHFSIFDSLIYLTVYFAFPAISIVIIYNLIKIVRNRLRGTQSQGNKQPKSRIFISWFLPTTSLVLLMLIGNMDFHFISELIIRYNYFTIGLRLIGFVLMLVTYIISFRLLYGTDSKNKILGVLKWIVAFAIWAFVLVFALEFLDIQDFW